MTPTFWLALPFYLAVGVILWRSSATLRDVFGEAGYYGGMIVFAVIWPFGLVWFACLTTVALLIGLGEKLFRRRK